MSRNPIILTPLHPETGQAAREARASLFTLLGLTVALGALLNALINHLGAPAPAEARWWAGLAAYLLGGLGLVYLGIGQDDRRVGLATTELTLVLPYCVTRRDAVSLGERRSYAVTRAASAAWRAAWGPTGLTLPPGDEPFNQRLLPYHLDLVRYLLALTLARFGRESEAPAAVHSWLRLTIPLDEQPWETLPPRLRDNRFAVAVGRARPAALRLPAGTILTVPTEGDCLLRLTWHWRPWLRWGPRGEIRLRWLGPLSGVRREDKRYELLTARLDAAAGHPYVVVTRLVVEVETRWNFLTGVARFRDWGLNLAHRWEQQLDYYAWYEYLVQRTILDLDWKIGWIEKGAEPGLTERLRRLDERLARLEAHLWPDEPPTGGRPGAWLSAPLPSGDPTADEDEAAAAP